MAREKLFVATFGMADGEKAHMSFYAETKALAVDHAQYCAKYGFAGGKDVPTGLLDVKHYPEAALNEGMTGVLVSDSSLLFKVP